MKQRPLSPHLTIYAPMITSASSIIGRFSGIYIYLIVVAIGIFMAFIIQSGKDVGSMLAMVMHFASLNKLNNLLVIGFSFVSVFAFLLYMQALVRHIIWDFGFLLNLKISKILGYLMFIIAFFGSLLINFYMFFI